MAKKADTPTTSLTATVRAETGKGASRRARRDGQVPAVLYGHGTAPQHLTLPARELAAVLRYSGTNAVLTLDIDGTQQLALTKVLDIHPIRRNIQHADLLVVRRGERLTVEVVVTVTGEPDAGALVTQESNAVEVEAEALSIPESIEVSVDGVAAGTQIAAAALTLPAGVTLVSDPELLVVNVVAPPTAAELEADGGGASLEEQAEADAAADTDGAAPAADPQ